MKKCKIFATILAAITSVVLLPSVFTLKASAAEPNTYYIDYDPDGYWYVLTEADMLDKAHAEQKVMQFFYNYVKNGDAVVVSCYYDNAPLLDLKNTRLGNVTILPDSSFFMIKAKEIVDFFALSNSFCSVSAPITNAYLYDPVIINFNDNVKDIVLNVESGASSSSMGGLGTVGSIEVRFTKSNSAYTLYDFKEGTFQFENGLVTTDPSDYSKIPNAAIVIPQPSTMPTLKDVFDEQYYADTYPDLKAAFGYNREALWTHYITSGIKEGRSMNHLLNVTYYRNQYADLSAVYGDNWDAYLAHYLTAGVKEGRDTGTEFNAIDYADRYEDLRDIYGYDILALWQHYRTIGIKEGREI